MSYSAPPPPGQGGPPGYGDQYGGGYVQPGNNQKAIWALVTGILGLLCCGLVGIAGIVLGSSAKREIDASGGAQTGRGMAQAGVVLGIIAVVWTVVALVLFVTGVLSLPSSSTAP
jgi:hypothetical protein